MAARRIHRWEMKKTSESEKKRGRKRWEQEHVRLRFMKPVYERWRKFMQENQVKTNDEAAVRLLDTWYKFQARLTMPITTGNQPRTESQPVHEPSTVPVSQPCTSTPQIFHAELHFPVSDISRGSEIKIKAEPSDDYGDHVGDNKATNIHRLSDVGVKEIKVKEELSDDYDFVDRGVESSKDGRLSDVGVKEMKVKEELSDDYDFVDRGVESTEDGRLSDVGVKEIKVKVELSDDYGYHDDDFKSAGGSSSEKEMKVKDEPMDDSSGFVDSREDRIFQC